MSTDMLKSTVLLLHYVLLRGIVLLCIPWEFSLHLAFDYEKTCKERAPPNHKLADLFLEIGG